MKTPPIPCDVAIEKSVPWLEEQLSPAEMEQIGEHLESCEDCANLFQRLDSIDLTPPRLKLRIGPEFWKPMERNLRRKMQTEWGVRQKWRVAPPIMAMAVTVLLLLSWALFERNNASNLVDEMQSLESTIESQQELIERYQRANFQPQPLQRDTLVLPVAYVPERHAL